jgi:hypothetical protein
MGWATLGLAIYGAALSSALAYLTWRKDRHSVRFFVSYNRREGWSGLVVNVVNTGFRPVTLHDAWFELDDGGGYLWELDENLGLPQRLVEGDQLALSFSADDIELGTAALVIRDTHRREHRMAFTTEVREQVDGLRRRAG